MDKALDSLSIKDLYALDIAVNWEILARLWWVSIPVILVLALMIHKDISKIQRGGNAQKGGEA